MITYTTTEAKAKALKDLMDKIINEAKRPEKALAIKHGRIGLAATRKGVVEIAIVQ